MIQKNKLYIDREDLKVLNSLKYLTRHFSTEKLLQYNVNDLFEKSKEFGLIHCVFDYYKNSMIIRDESSPFFMYCRVAEEYFLLQKEIWNEVNHALQQANISALVCKGFHLLNTVYMKRSKYIVNDIDILVKKNSLSITKKIVKNLGYSQNILNTNDSIITFIEKDTILEFEEKHYELFPFTKIIEAPQFKSYFKFIKQYLIGHPFIIENDNIYVAVELDIHHNLSIGFDVEDIWNDYCKFRIDNIESLALSYNTLGWFLPARLYYEVMVFNKLKLKMLSDIANIIKSEKLDYDIVMEAADKYSLHPSLLYVYNYLQRIVGLPIPKKFLKELNLRASIKSSYRDWGDFIPKIVNTRIVTERFIPK